MTFITLKVSLFFTVFSLIKTGQWLQLLHWTSYGISLALNDWHIGLGVTTSSFTSTHPFINEKQIFPRKSTMMLLPTSCRYMIQEFTGPKCKFYFIIPYTSTLIRLSRLYQEWHAHCIVITNDGRWDRWSWLIYIRVWVGGQGLSIILQFLFFSCAFVFCCLLFSIPFFRWLEHDVCFVSFFCFLF